MVAPGAAWGCAGKVRESMEASVNRGVPWGRLIGVIVVFLLTGVFAAAASAADTVTIQQSQPYPVVGESVTFTAPAVSDCPKTYTFTVDGTALPPQIDGQHHPLLLDRGIAHRLG